MKLLNLLNPITAKSVSSMTREELEEEVNLWRAKSGLVTIGIIKAAEATVNAMSTHLKLIEHLFAVVPKPDELPAMTLQGAKSSFTQINNRFERVIERSNAAVTDATDHLARIKENISNRHTSDPFKKESKNKFDA